MAIVTTTLDAKQYFFPYAGYVDADVAVSPIPRGEIRVHTLTPDSIPAPGAGNNQVLTISETLPANFAYVLMDFNLEVFTGTAGTFNFPAQGDCRLTDSLTQGTSKVFAPMGLTSEGVGFRSNGVESRVYRLVERYKGTVVPQTTQGQLFGALYNSTANDVSYSAILSARFLQYDVDQANYYGINNAIATR